MSIKMYLLAGSCQGQAVFDTGAAPARCRCPRPCLLLVLPQELPPPAASIPLPARPLCPSGPVLSELVWGWNAVNYRKTVLVSLTGAAVSKCLYSMTGSGRLLRSESSRKDAAESRNHRLDSAGRDWKGHQVLTPS